MSSTGSTPAQLATLIATGSQEEPSVKRQFKKAQNPFSRTPSMFIQGELNTLFANVATRTSTDWLTICTRLHSVVYDALQQYAGAEDELKVAFEELMKGLVKKTNMKNKKKLEGECTQQVHIITTEKVGRFCLVRYQQNNTDSQVSVFRYAVFSLDGRGFSMSMSKMAQDASTILTKATTVDDMLPTSMPDMAAFMLPGQEERPMRQCVPLTKHDGDFIHVILNKEETGQMTVVLMTSMGGSVVEHTFDVCDDAALTELVKKVKAISYGVEVNDLRYFMRLLVSAVAHQSSCTVFAFGEMVVAGQHPGAAATGFYVLSPTTITHFREHTNADATLIEYLQKCKDSLFGLDVPCNELPNFFEVGGKLAEILGQFATAADVVKAAHVLSIAASQVCGNPTEFLKKHSITFPEDARKKQRLQVYSDALLQLVALWSDNQKTEGWMLMNCKLKTPIWKYLHLLKQVAEQGATFNSVVSQLLDSLRFVESCLTATRDNINKYKEGLIANFTRTGVYVWHLLQQDNVPEHLKDILDWRPMRMSSFVGDEHLEGQCIGQLKNLARDSAWFSLKTFLCLLKSHEGKLGERQVIFIDFDGSHDTPTRCHALRLTLAHLREMDIRTPVVFLTGNKSATFKHYPELSELLAWHNMDLAWNPTFKQFFTEESPLVPVICPIFGCREFAGSITLAEYKAHVLTFVENGFLLDDSALVAAACKRNRVSDRLSTINNKFHFWAQYLNHISNMVMAFKNSIGLTYYKYAFADFIRSDLDSLFNAEQQLPKWFEELAETCEESPLPIALTGHQGSGKSTRAIVSIITHLTKKEKVGLGMTWTAFWESQRKDFTSAESVVAWMLMNLHAYVDADMFLPRLANVAGSFDSKCLDLSTRMRDTFVDFLHSLEPDMQVVVAATNPRKAIRFVEPSVNLGKKDAVESAITLAVQNGKLVCLDKVMTSFTEYCECVKRERRTPPQLPGAQPVFGAFLVKVNGESQHMLTCFKRLATVALLFPELQILSAEKLCIVRLGSADAYTRALYLNIRLQAHPSSPVEEFVAHITLENVNGNSGMMHCVKVSADDLSVNVDGVVVESGCVVDGLQVVIEPDVSAYVVEISSIYYLTFNARANIQTLMESPDLDGFIDAADYPDDAAVKHMTVGARGPMKAVVKPCDNVVFVV